METPRLLVRRFRQDDIERIYALIYADHEVRDAWSTYRGTLDQFRQRFETDARWRAEGGLGYQAVTLRESGEVIGLMGFQRYLPGEDAWYMAVADPPDALTHDPAVIECELTYALGRAYWGHGYATEAGRAMLAAGFTQWGVWRVLNAVAVANTRSVNLMRRLGMRLVPNLNEGYLTEGPFKGSRGVIGILDRETWRARHAEEKVIAGKRDRSADG